MEFTTASYEGEACLQVVFRRAGVRTRNWRARSRNCASATRSPACSTAPPSCARWRTPSPTPPRTATATTRCCWSSRTTTQRLLQDIGLDAADELIAALRRAPARARCGDDDVAARFGEHQFAVLARNSDHAQHRDAGRSACARPSPTTCSKSASARSRHRQHRRRADRREDRQRHARCWPRPATACSRRSAWAATAPRSSTPARSTAPRKSACRPGSTRIREALDGDGFVLHYQPVISLHGDPSEIYEALLRMQGDRRRAGAAADLPADRRGTRPAAAKSTAGWSSRAIAVIGRAHARRQATPRCWSRSAQASLQDDSLLDAHRRAAGRSTACPASRLVLQLPEPRCSPTSRAAQAFQPARRQARLPRGAGAVRRGPELVPAAQPLRAGLPQDRPRLHRGPGREHRATRRRSARSPRKASELGKQTIAEYVQDAAA